MRRIVDPSAIRRERNETKMGLEDSRAPQEPSRIIIADDHPLFRSALVRMFDAAFDLEVVGEAADGRQALDLCRRLRPELVLMDLRMPQMDGIAATHAIKRELPETLVLILTALDESTGLSNSLEAGAAGYILKHSSASQITDAVRRVLAGGSALNEELAKRLLMRLIPREGQKKEEALADSSTSERHARGKRVQAAGASWAQVSFPVVHMRQRVSPAAWLPTHEGKAVSERQSIRGSSRRPCLRCQSARDSSGYSGKCLSSGPEGISHHGAA